MNKKVINNTSSEVIAAFLDGNATATESQEILAALADDAELRELLHISQMIDAELGAIDDSCDYIPMAAMAASCNEDAYCCLECEKHIMKLLDVEYDEDQLINDAKQNGWHKENGTALHNIGRHLEKAGFVVTRCYYSTIEDIVTALESNEKVIVAIDGGELLGDKTAEIKEDLLVGQIPDHTVVVLSVNDSDKTITIYDPNSMNPEDTYPIKMFEDAWNDSKNYLVTITYNCMKPYNPKPIDLTDVILTEDFNELREAIAENAHDVWAVERQSQGWTYGPYRDDSKKETPCMVPYSQLPDSEKKFDRDMAMNTLKLVKKLGYDLIKREDTELYQVLKKRIQDSDETFFCRQCGNPIYKHQVFCDRCGLELKMDWK